MNNNSDFYSRLLTEQLVQDPSSIIDFLAQGRLKRVLNRGNCKTEQELRVHLGLKSLIYFADACESDPEGILIKLSTFIDTLTKTSADQEILVLCFHGLMKMFQKENWVGPSVLYKSIDKQLKRDKKLKAQKTGKRYDQEAIVNYSELFESQSLELEVPLQQFWCYNYDYVKSRQFVCKRCPKIARLLESNGEEWFKVTPLAHLFFILFNVIELLDSKLKNFYTTIWRARVLFIRNLYLESPAQDLKLEVFKSYQKFFTQIFSKSALFSKQIVSNFYLEFSNCCLFYHKYQTSTKSIEFSENLLNVEFTFTGKLGRRTKFQTFDVAQLIVQAQEKKDEPVSAKSEPLESTEDEQIFAHEMKEIVPLKDILQQENQNPRNFDLEEDTILFERPMITDTQPSVSEVDLEVYHQILILQKIHNLNTTNPKDDVLCEQVQAYCNKILEKSQNWLVYSNSLLFRSLNEFTKLKRMDRSILQLQNLLDQFNDPEPNSAVRQKYLFCLSYPHQIELQKMVAEKFMRYGSIMSSCQIYEKLEMMEECVECLAGAGHIEKSKQMALDLLAQGKESPKLYCLMGGIFQDISYFKKSWKLSNKRYGKAQKALARCYFYSNKLEKCVKAFAKSIQINSFQSDACFMQGCAYLKLNQLKQAIQSFSSVISMDETQGEAWANMASAFQSLGEQAKSFSTLEQAVKHCESNWRIWQNLLQVSLSNQKFYRFFSCIEQLVKLDKKEVITEEVVKKVNQVFRYQISQMIKSGYKSIFQTYRERVRRLFEFLLKDLGQKHYVYEEYANFLQIDIDFNQIKYEFQSQALAKEKSTEKETENQRVTFQETNEAEKLLTKYKELQSSHRNRILEIRQKECQVLMEINWESSPQICENLENAIVRMIEHMKVLELTPKSLLEYNIFFKSVQSKIADKLERETKYKIN